MKPPLSARVGCIGECWWGWKGIIRQLLKHYSREGNSSNFIPFADRDGFVLARAVFGDKSLNGRDFWRYIDPKTKEEKRLGSHPTYAKS